MNLYQEIRAEHRVMRTLVSLVESAPEASRSLAFEKLQLEVRVHHRVEEAVLYTELKRQGASSSRLERILDEHRNLERLLDVLDVPAKESEAWRAVFGRFAESLERHLAEEERGLFGEARRAIQGADAFELGRKMATGADAIKRVFSRRGIVDLHRGERLRD